MREIFGADVAARAFIFPSKAKIQFQGLSGRFFLLSVRLSSLSSVSLKKYPDENLFVFLFLRALRRRRGAVAGRRFTEGACANLAWLGRFGGDLWRDDLVS
ncbi:hypothetical protein H6P81_018350 [Aristolochia fimbriata]|uniref:Uncharacterized protein n=1 Tax=Aristolochia fimbriata TaxID=158543 RepID=A0AAV7E3S3_ARIFI|nr:hypothetical protein H6P81_018350 [Aristolochia fimbriata]